MRRTHGAKRKMERSEYRSSSLSRYRLSEPTEGGALDGEGEGVELEKEVLAVKRGEVDEVALAAVLLKSARVVVLFRLWVGGCSLCKYSSL